MRKPIQERVRKVRKQLEQQRQTATGPEAEQVAVLADYALGVQTAVNLDGKQPFDYAGIAAYEALSAIQSSLQEVEKNQDGKPILTYAHLQGTQRAISCSSQDRLAILEKKGR